MGICGASAVLLANTFWQALVLEPPPRPPASAPPVDQVRIVVRGGTPVELRALAVEADPFHPERRRPTVPFRFPGEGVEEEAMPIVMEQIAPVRLIGTAVLPEGKGFAMCEIPGQAPKVVRIGETAAGLTLREVEPGRAIFITAGGESIVLEVQKAGT